MVLNSILETVGINSTDYKPMIDRFAENLKTIIYYILLKGIDVFIYILRPLYIILIVYGLIKYSASGLNYRSRNILIGGLILAVFTEGVLPIILELLK